MSKRKIGYKIIFIDLIESIGVKQGFIKTIKDLIIKPEEVVEYFVESREGQNQERTKYLSPLKLLMFVIAFISILSLIVGYDVTIGPDENYLTTKKEFLKENENYFEDVGYKKDTDYGDARIEFEYQEEERFDKDIYEVYKNNKITISIITALISAFISKLLFYRKKEINTAFHFVIYIYVWSLLLLVTPFSIYLDQQISEYSSFILTLTYCSYVVYRFFKPSILAAIIKGLLIGFIPITIMLISILIYNIALGDYYNEEKFYEENPTFIDLDKCYGDCEDGWGTYTWGDGETYTGEWKDGLPHGKGTYKWADGETYTGDFINGEIME
ncbi:MAG: hypothetical protein CMD02_04485 [Flavobacteriales bacterium]|nr:hypothetical protein [Flavobacteriales bacterium]|tara:strand:- start:244 stop:1227 length:984 start_codon:yes stop_codon:yes gene_type:complete